MMGLQIGLFDAIVKSGSKPITTAELSERTKYSKSLICTSFATSIV